MKAFLVQRSEVGLLALSERCKAYSSIIKLRQFKYVFRLCCCTFVRVDNPRPQLHMRGVTGHR